MAKTYRVFTSTPLASPGKKTTSFSWITASSRAVSPPLPLATYDKAIHQISLLYQNVIFGNDDENNEETDGEFLTNSGAYDTSIESQKTHPVNLSTRLDITNQDYSSISETHDAVSLEGETTMQSEGSSISRFPVFNFNINNLSSLSTLINASRHDTAVPVLMILLGVLEVDGPYYVNVKTGAHAGSEVCLLKLIVGDDQGAVCKLVVWRETAEAWSGLNREPCLKRGDIVLFENVLFSNNLRRPREQPDFAKAQITASPNQKSNAVVCYRTLPRIREDRQWRPDLRLAGSVLAVRMVRDAVSWMECMAGIPAS